MTSQSITELSPEQGLFELSMLNAERAQDEFDDVMIEGLKRGIPPEILTRLKDIWDATQEIAGEIITIGKIIVIEIINFLKANVKLTIGLALGAAVSSLLLMIPILGPILLPLSTLLASLYGAGVGAAVQKGDYSASPLTAAIALADEFFELFVRIMKAISQYWKNK